MIWHLLQKCCLLEKSRKFLVKLIWRKFSKILAKIAKFWGKAGKIQQLLTKILRLLK